MNLSTTQVDTGILIRRSLFFLVLIIFTLGNLFVLFKGLNSPQAMDQAQISREIARGHGFTTKMIRPVAYDQAQRAQKRSISLVGFQDTYHSPLNPLLNAAVLKIIGADKPNSWQMGANEMVFPLDRVIATVSTLFFLLAIGVNYLLIARIFDAKIAGVCAILMLFCDSFWNYSLSGLPQMLMLLLFSSALYFAYRAVEATTEGRLAMTPALIAGVFFTLLALTHWMTVWIALGYIIFAAVAFRPRGVIGITILVLLIIAGIGPILRNQSITGSPFGTAFLTVYNGLSNSGEAAVMRTADLESEPLVIDGLIAKILRTTLMQSMDIIPLLGGIIVAPLFFLSLLHPFKRASISSFRWAILVMWILAAFGLAIFGISKDPLDPNQIHLLFAPIMTAYGLAFVSILWSRLEFVASTPMLRNVHYFLIVGICALPLVLALPMKVRVGMHLRDRGGVPNWPPYYAPALNSKTAGIRGWTTDDEVIFSDQPWAVAWYADRLSIWLPPTYAGFEKLETIANDLQTPVTGLLISPCSHGLGSLTEVANQYKDFSFMVLDGRTFFTNRYPYRQPMVGMDMVYYSDRAIRPPDSN